MSESTLSTLPGVPELEGSAEESYKATQNYRLKLKLGQAEFEAEGPVDQVKEHYQEFLTLVSKVGSNLKLNESSSVPNGGSNESDPIETSWDRVYMRTEDKLSLNIIPDTKFSNGDSILLIIYGYQKLFEKDGVGSQAIMEAAKQSGLRIDRVARSLTSDQSKLVLMGGSGKGARYSLNNRGFQYVESLIEEMFD